MLVVDYLEGPGSQSRSFSSYGWASVPAFEIVDEDLLPVVELIAGWASIDYAVSFFLEERDFKLCSNLYIQAEHHVDTSLFTDQPGARLSVRVGLCHDVLQGVATQFHARTFAREWVWHVLVVPNHEVIGVILAELQWLVKDTLSEHTAFFIQG